MMTRAEPLTEEGRVPHIAKLNSELEMEDMMVRVKKKSFTHQLSNSFFTFA